MTTIAATTINIEKPCVTPSSTTNPTRTPDGRSTDWTPHDHRHVARRCALGPLVLVDSSRPSSGVWRRRWRGSVSVGVGGFGVMSGSSTRSCGFADQDRSSDRTPTSVGGEHGVERIRGGAVPAVAALRRRARRCRSSGCARPGTPRPPPRWRRTAMPVRSRLSDRRRRPGRGTRRSNGLVVRSQVSLRRPVHRTERRRDAVGIRERVSDRQPHVGLRQLGDRRPVGELRHRVHDRLGMHDDLDLVVVHVEQLMSLDDLQTLVHQRRRVDSDLGAHGPGGVRQGLVDGHRREFASATSPGTARPTLSVRHAGVVANPRLPAGTDGSHSARCRQGRSRRPVSIEPPHHWTSGDQRLLVGQSQTTSCPQRCHRHR